MDLNEFDTSYRHIGHTKTISPKKSVNVTNASAVLSAGVPARMVPDGLRSETYPNSVIQLDGAEELTRSVYI